MPTRPLATPRQNALEAAQSPLDPENASSTSSAKQGARLVRVKTYKEAVRLARCAGEDAANRRMRNGGRKAWSPADHDHAARVTEKILVDLGFDITGWVAMGGMPRNEPPEPTPAKRSRNRRRTMAAPMQLSFGF